MKYPTIEEVEEAGLTQLRTWLRFLEIPGVSAIRNGSHAWNECRERERVIYELIQARFNSFQVAPPTKGSTTHAQS